jgi:hypothetical protein
MRTRNEIMVHTSIYRTQGRGPSHRVKLQVRGDRLIMKREERKDEVDWIKY